MKNTNETEEKAKEKILETLATSQVRVETGISSRTSFVETDRKWNIKFDDKGDPKDVFLFMERL